MNTTATISRWGNSLAVRIPKGILERSRVREGDRLELDVSEDGGLVLRPVCRPCSLEELVRGITPENCPSETDWGATRGKEAW